MTDDAAWTVAWSVLPGADREPAPAAPDPARLARRVTTVDGFVVPACSRIGHPSALAQIVEPIDLLEPAHDPVHLLSAARTAEYRATVLAHAVAAAPLRES